MNNNDFQGVLHNWDIDNREDEDEFWKKEEQRLLDELEEDDGGGRRLTPKHRKQERDRGVDRER